MSSLLFDLRHAARGLWRRRAFSILAIVTAGFAVGATTAVYSTVDWLLNRPPGGVIEPDRLVTMRSTDGESSLTFSFPWYRSIREAQDVFTDLAAHAKIPGVVSTDTQSDQVVFEFVTGNYFPMLGVQPELGRIIGPDDDVPGGMPAVMLSHTFWLRQFAGDPSVVGRTLTLNGQPAVVVGIVSHAFEGYSLNWNGPTSVFLPVQSYTDMYRSDMLTRVGQGGIFFPIIGRLRPDVTIDAARARAQSWVPLLTGAPGDRFRATAIQMGPSSDTRISARDETRQFFAVLLTVCVVVLLAACFNIANFLLGWAVARRAEIGLRAALGASRWRVARQVLLEAGLLGGAAAGVGMAVAVALIHLSSAAPRLFLRLPVTTEAVIDGRMAIVSGLLGLLSAVVFGLVPAVAVAWRNPIADMKNARPTWGWSGVRISTRQLLLALQVALSVVLTATAGFYVYSLAGVVGRDSGYREPERVLVARVVPWGKTQDEAQGFYGEFMPALRAMPGVVSASIGWNPPYSIGRNFISLPGATDAPIEAGATAAAPEFFETLGIPLVAGREFDGSIDELQRGLIINQVLAEQLWPNDAAVGRTLMYGTSERVVTGVTAEQRCRNILGPPEPCSYQPFPFSPGYLRVRVSGDPMALVPDLRGLIHRIDPNVALAEEVRLDSHLRELTGAERMSAVATAALALLGIVLLAAGCVTLFVSMVRDSVREIAIRLALGATQGHLSRRILLRGFAITVIGLTIGLWAGWGVATRIADQLYEVSIGDYGVWLATTALVLVVSLASVSVAAVIAARTEPSHLLKAD